MLSWSQTTMRRVIVFGKAGCTAKGGNVHIKYFAFVALGLIVVSPRGMRARSANDSRWIEVRSPNFTVVSNAGARSAQRVAIQLETVYSFFHHAFTGMRLYPRPPIIVLALNDEASFRDLEPERLRRKGELRAAGLMYGYFDKNCIMLQLDAGFEHPYEVIYHEFTHSVVESTFRNVPLWLNEGLAQFYGGLSIDKNEVFFGQPSDEAIAELRQYPLVPLTTLFAVNESSPYYNKQHQGNIFYAESWALTHYLMSTGPRAHKDFLGPYLHDVGDGMDPTAAAAKDFGDLNSLQRALDQYVHLRAFYEFSMKVSSPIDKKSLQTRKLSPAESEAYRGDFLARAGRFNDAEKMLQEALQRDPSLVGVNESMGTAELSQHHAKRAEQWFAKASKLCPQCYLARFEYSAMTVMADSENHTPPTPQKAAQDTANFLAFMNINAKFAPAYADLALLDSMLPGHLNEAHLMALAAVELEPKDVDYYVLSGQILVKMGQAENALSVAKRALAIATTPKEQAAAHEFLNEVLQRIHGPSQLPGLIPPNGN